MEKRIRQLLMHWPALYHFAQRVYKRSSFQRLKEHLAGTKMNETVWARRHLTKGNDWNNTQHVGEDDEWVLSYWDSRNHSHRPFLVERISAYYPFTNVLEIGCNCGPNLYLLAKKFPDREMRGIDINPRAVEIGNELFKSEGILNVKLSCCKVGELGQFRSKSFDIVFTDAVLIYVGPDKIKKVIEEMVRVTRKTLILVEWHTFEAKNSKYDPRGTYVGNWARDYVTLLKEFVSEDRIHVTKLSEKLWPDKNWQRWGGVIEVSISPASAGAYI